MLREGNSDRRAPESVKNYARKHPHSMGEWSSGLEDQRRAHGRPTTSASNEKSVVIEKAGSLRIELVTDDGTEVLKESVPVEAGEVVDATFMNVAALQAFLREQIARAKADDVLFSVHLKATMMKVSDPIIFGHAVQAFFPTLFAEQGEALPRGAASTRTTASAASSPAPRSSAARSGRDQGRRRAGTRRRARRWPWSTPTRASPTCTCRAT